MKPFSCGDCITETALRKTVFEKGGLEFFMKMLRSPHNILQFEAMKTLNLAGAQGYSIIICKRRILTASIITAEERQSLLNGEVIPQVLATLQASLARNEQPNCSQIDSQLLLMCVALLANLSGEGA